MDDEPEHGAGTVSEYIDPTIERVDGEASAADGREPIEVTTEVDRRDTDGDLEVRDELNHELSSKERGAERLDAWPLGGRDTKVERDAVGPSEGEADDVVRRGGGDTRPVG